MTTCPLLATPDVALGVVFLAILCVVALFSLLILVGRLAFGILRTIVRLLARALGVTGPQPSYGRMAAGHPIAAPRSDNDSEQTCPNVACGRQNPPEAVYCGRCGHKL